MVARVAAMRRDEPAQVATSTRGTSTPAGDKAGRGQLEVSLWRCCKASDE